jgi:hypothetical protein
VVPFTFLVLGSVRGAAGRAFPAMLQARACKSRRCQFSVIFTEPVDARKSRVVRSPFLSRSGSTLLCGSSSAVTAMDSGDIRPPLNQKSAPSSVPQRVELQVEPDVVAT